MFQALKERFTRSGRFERSKMRAACPDEDELGPQAKDKPWLRILNLINENDWSFLMMFETMDSQGQAGLERLKNENFDELYGGFVPGAFRIGPIVFDESNRSNSGLGIAVLESAQPIHGKETDRSVILISVPVWVEERTNEDSFILAISRVGRTWDLDIAMGWRYDPKRSSWPVDQRVLDALYDRVQGVINILSSLELDRVVQAA